METRKRSRRCGFCGDFYHNRRTCESRKRAVLAFYKERAEVRKSVLDKMRENGCGIGAIVTDGEHIFFVKDIAWDNINKSPYSAVLLVSRLGVETETAWYIELPYNFYFEQRDHENQPYNVKVLNSVNENNIGNNLSDDWWNGTSGYLPMYLQ